MPSRTDLRDSLQLAAALTDLKIDIVDGKAAPEDQKAFPPHAEDFGTHNPAMGAWYLLKHTRIVQRYLLTFYLQASTHGHTANHCRAEHLLSHRDGK